MAASPATNLIRYPFTSFLLGSVRCRGKATI